MDLERLFRQIVVTLAATDPARLSRPLPLTDICDSVVPYRANRRALQIESSEDYEIALMRLCGGEAGLAHTDPGEIQAEFASEVASPNPDLSLLHRHPEVVLNLNPEAVARVLQSRPDLKFAPQRSPIPEAPGKVPRGSPTGASYAPIEAPLLQCSRCGATLPVGRVVNFCPQCGQTLARRHCPQCNTELEGTWKHCVGCGASVSQHGQ